MKKLLFLTLILLASCASSAGTGDSMSIDLLSEDLRALLSDEPSDDLSPLPFATEASIGPSSQKEGYFVVSVTVSYSGSFLENVRILTVPSAYTLENHPSVVASVGYEGHALSLSEVTDVEQYRFCGFRVSYLSENASDGVKVSVRDAERLWRYSISAENFSERS